MVSALSGPSDRRRKGENGGSDFICKDIMETCMDN